MPLPTAESLTTALAQMERDLALLEAAFGQATFELASGDGTIKVVASRAVELVSVTINQDQVDTLPARDLADKVRPVCAAALARAVSESSAEAAARAGGYNLPGLPGASAPPPFDQGFDRVVGGLIAAVPAVEAAVRQRFFEGRDGAVRAVVDGALELRALEYTPPLPEHAPALAASTLVAINAALVRAKNLFEDTVLDAGRKLTGAEPAPVLVDPRPRVLLVIENVTTVRPSDEALRARLAALGFNVTVRKAASTASADANGQTLIVVSETIQADDLGTKFTSAAVPMLVCEPTTFRDLKMTGGVWQTDKGDIFDQDKLQITAGHPLAAGLSGLVTVTTKKSKFIWGKPAAAAAKVAAIAGQSNKWGIFAYDTGDAMVGLAAPARRVGFLVGRDTFSSLNAEGWKLFDAAVRWATAARALLTAKSTTLGSGDQALKQRLQSTHGLEVTVRAEGDTRISDLRDMRIHLISESVSSTSIGPRYLTSVAPTVVCEANLYDDMKMTGAASNTDFGELEPASDLEVTPGHPLAAGLSGLVRVVSPGQKFGWGKPGPEAAKVARLPGAVERWGIFGYEGGANMVGARASAPRLGFFSGGEAPAAFTPDGWTLFDAAVRWARAPRALLVVKDIPLRPDDEALRQRLSTSFGFVVDVKKAPDVLDVHCNGKQVIVVSESVAASDVGARLTNVAVPVVALEPSLFDDLKMTGTASDADFGTTTNQGELDIVKADHPLAGGLAIGRVAVVGTPSRFVWGKPASAAVKIARLVGTTDRWGLFGYESGANMVGKTAPARRVGCFVGEQTALALDDRGRRLLDAAVLWAAGRIEVRGSAPSLADVVLGTAPAGPSGGGTSPPAGTWHTVVAYDIGDEVSHLGLAYRCRQAHTSQAGWEPPVTYALWARIASGEAWTLQAMYDVSDEVTHQGVRYRALQFHQAVAGAEPPVAPALWQRR